jgi:hypothetical protein
VCVTRFTIACSFHRDPTIADVIVVSKLFLAGGTGAI